MIIGTGSGMSKESEMPDKPFLFIGARSLIDSALTADVGKIIESKKGRFLKLKVFESYNGYQDKGFCFETELIHFDKVIFPEWVEKFDMYYRLFFHLKEGGESIKKLCREYADSDLDYAEAWGQCTSHWGSQRWSGLMAAIVEETGVGIELIHGTQVDIFAPYCEKLSENLIVYSLYSHRRRPAQSILKE